MPHKNLITLADLASFKDSDLHRRRDDLSAYLGRPVTDEDGLTMAEWATLRRATHESGGEMLSTSMPDLSWLMFHIDQVRWGRAFASVLEAILPDSADPRFRAVIPMLRNGVQEREVADQAWAAWVESPHVRAAEWAAMASAATTTAGVAFEVGQAAESERASTRTILLTGWGE